MCLRQGDEITASLRAARNVHRLRGASQIFVLHEKGETMKLWNLLAKAFVGGGIVIGACALLADDPIPKDAKDTEEAVKNAKDDEIVPAPKPKSPKPADDENPVVKKTAVKESTGGKASVKTTVEQDTDTPIRSTGSAAFNAKSARSADFGLWFNRATDRGLVVSDVGTTGAVAKLGFDEGDRIITVNGQKVASENEFVQYLLADNVRSKRVEVVVFRGDKQQMVYVEPSVLVKEYTTITVDPLEDYGLIIDDRYTDRIVIWRVIPRSPAYYAGIRAGDVITVFNGNNVTTVGALRASVRAAPPGNVSMSVSRSSKIRVYQIEAP
jgi:predicted metalloprotease with PDZ domain